MGIVPLILNFIKVTNVLLHEVKELLTHIKQVSIQFWPSPPLILIPKGIDFHLFNSFFYYLPSHFYNLSLILFLNFKIYLFSISFLLEKMRNWRSHHWALISFCCLPDLGLCILLHQLPVFFWQCIIHADLVYIRIISPFL